MNLPIKKSEFLQRSKGIGFLSYKTIDNTTKLNDLFQQGSLKIRFPSSFNEFSEAVLINTAGGYTGGDYCKLKIEVDKYSKVLISGQAAEKVYKCIDGKVKIINQIYLGEKIPRKGGPGITRSDFLLINKIDLAELVGASLEVMERDTKKMRIDLPWQFTNLKKGEGVQPLVQFIKDKGGLN